MKHTALFSGIAALAALAWSGSPSLAAPAPRSISTHLSASALSQIAALESDADARTSVQQRISSQLLYTQRMARGQQIAPGITQLHTGVQVDGAGLTLIDMDAAITPELLCAIVRVGGQVVHASADFGQARLRVPLASLETLAAIPGVRFLKPAMLAQLNNPVNRHMSSKSVNVLTPFTLPLPQRVALTPRQATVRAALPGLLSHLAASVPGPTTNAGSEISEGDKTHQADKARSTFHIDGTGIKVGVLSDSLDDSIGSYADAKGSGDVSAVTVIKDANGVVQDGGTGEAEGLAMLEIVHDLAPGAQLYFATGFNGEASMADNIVSLQKAGCQVIIDDVSYFDEPAFQDGTIAKAVNTVTAAGTMYFSSAANYGNLENYSSSVWEGDFKDSGTSLSDGKLHDFSGLGDTGNEADISGDSAYISLFWADPLGKSTNDYDLFIMDASGENVVASSTDRQTGAQDPIEMAQAAYGQRVAIVLHKGSARFLHVDINAQNSLFNFSTNGRTRGHNAGLNTFSCAATDATEAYPDPFSTGNSVEGFSSDGPRRIFFNPDGSAITSGNFTHTGGSALKKPDFTAADGVSTTLPYAQGLNPFYGTSAAAPHAGAIAALMLSYNKTLTHAQVATILDSSATDIEDSGYDVISGYGILNALKALQNTPAPTTGVTISTLALTPTSVTAGQTSLGKITLSAVAPAGGATITLKSSDTGSATVPASVTIAAGNKSISFTIATKSATSTKTPTITTTLGTSVKTATLTITPAVTAVTVQSLSASPTSVAGGAATSTGTVTLTGAAPTGGLAVTLKSSDTSAATVAGTLNIAAGATSAKFKITTYAVTSTKTVTITATAGSTSKTATLSVTGTAPKVTPTSLTFNPNSISSDGQSTGTVTLSRAAPSDGADVVIAYQGSTVLTATVAPGATSTTFMLNFGEVSSTSTLSIDASLNGKTVSGTITVKATTVKPTSLSLSPSTVSGGGSTTGTVTLSATAPKGGAVVKIYQGDVYLGYTVVPGGQSSVSFTYTPATVTTQTKYTESAVYNGITVTTSLTVKP